MRSHRFKGWDRKAEKWRYGSLLAVPGLDLAYIIEDNLAHYEVDQRTVGQRTDKQDRNGHDIYEGDELACAWMPGHLFVEWNAKDECFKLERGGDGKVWLLGELPDTSLFIVGTMVERLVRQARL